MFGFVFFFFKQKTAYERRISDWSSDVWLLRSINQAGGRAVGISGKDANFVTASKVQRTTRDPGSLIEQAVDLGFVGEPSKVDRSLLDTLSAAGMIPVVAPIGVGTDGATYNINADTMAGAVAAAVGASRLFLLTDVRSEEHTSELQSLMRNSYAVFCL